MSDTLSITDQWPDSGRVQFIDFRLRYGVDLPWVLNGVTFNIRALEKVGVVGRTGAGLYHNVSQFLNVKSKLCIHIRVYTSHTWYFD